MKRTFALTLSLTVSLALLAFAQQPSLINTVRGLIAKNDLAGAERVARDLSGPHARFPGTGRRPLLAGPRRPGGQKLRPRRRPGRRSLQNGLPLPPSQKLDDDPWLPTAAGAAIEVHAQVLAARGERAEAIEYLQGQLKQFAGTSLPERISKNINLLGLEGKPAPELDLLPPSGWEPSRPPSPACAAAPCCSSSGRTGAAIVKPRSPSWPISRRPSKTKASRSSGPLACTGMSPAARTLRRRRRNVHRGGPPPLLCRPTRHAGASERRQLHRLWRQLTPTLVLIDRAGVVRYYHPGAASEAELSARNPRRSLSHAVWRPALFRYRSSPRRAYSSRDSIRVSIAERRAYRYSSSLRMAAMPGSCRESFLREHSTDVPERLILQ